MWVWKIQILFICMKMLITDKQFNQLNSRDKIPFECKKCTNTFYRKKHHVQSSLSKKETITFCSHKCSAKEREEKIETVCKNCEKPIQITPSVLRKSKSKNVFCSSSCSSTYNNTHKTYGYRRSKLEVWLEKELSKIYSLLEFHYNKKDTINSELDIYIPSLKLAFELNGIFHYEPIFSEKKLKQTQNNDQRKFQACLEKGIELCIIDISKMNYFKEKNAQGFFQIISKIISKKMEHGVGVEPTCGFRLPVWKTGA